MFKIKENVNKIIPIVVLASVVIPIIYLIVELILGRNYNSDKILTLIVSILVLIAFFVPNIISKKWNLVIPESLYIAFVIFLYCASFLGELKGFYYSYKYWDELLHFFSAMILGILAYSIIFILNDKTQNIHISPWFVSLFAISFSMFAGVLWELFEFGIDIAFKTNMQKYMLEDGTMLVGNQALFDTMKDMIINFAGALVVSIMGYISIKSNKKWFQKFLIKKK